MYQLIKLLNISGSLRLIALFAVILSLNGCAAIKGVFPDSQYISGQGTENFERNEFSASRGEDVLGRLRFVRLENGDTLPDIARHFSVGLNAVTATNPGVDVWAPEDGKRVILPLSFILPDAPRKGIVINLAAMRLFQFKGNNQPQTVLTYPVGVGADDRPTPMGLMQVNRKVFRPTWYVPASIAAARLKKGDLLPASVSPGPQNPLGEYALYLSKPSYLIHGTNKPASIGLRATNGCIRLFPEDIKKIFNNTPVKTPVNIVYQPYLLGQRNGLVYLEVHESTNDLNTAEFDKIYKKLKTIEKTSGRSLDWSKVKAALADARGIPVPIFKISDGSSKMVEEIIEVSHPNELYGKPKIPELKTDLWAVLAAEMRDEIDAVRLSAIINHQGPQIPARVLAKNNSYHVVAGPFKDIKDAKDAIKRLKIDLELEGSLIEPVKKR